MTLSKETKRISRNIGRRVDRYADMVSSSCGHDELLYPAFEYRDRIMRDLETELERLVRNQIPDRAATDKPAPGPRA